MNINSVKLRNLAKERGASVEDLAGALVRPGLDAKAANSALRNWMAGRNHPRAKRKDIEALVGALGCELSEIARWVHKSAFQRTSPRKTQLLVDLIRGKGIEEAENLLTYNHRRASMFVMKSLKAVTSDAEHFGADLGELVVVEARVDEGPIIKRFQPKDRGRAHPIQKKTCHIVLGVEEKS